MADVHIVEIVVRILMVAVIVHQIAGGRTTDFQIIIAKVAGMNMHPLKVRYLMVHG